MVEEQVGEEKMKKFIILLMVFMVPVALALDYTGGTTNTDLNITSETTELQLTAHTKLTIKTNLTNFTQHINILSSENFSSKPQSIYNQSVIYATVYESLIVDLDYNESANYTLITDTSNINTIEILSNTLNWYYYTGSAWERNGILETVPNDYSATKFVLAGYSPIIEQTIVNASCPACEQTSQTWCESTYSCYTNASYLSRINELNNSYRNAKDDYEDCEEDYDKLDDDYDDCKDERTDYWNNYKSCLATKTECDYSANCPTLSCDYKENCPDCPTQMTYSEMCGSTQQNISLTCPACPECPEVAVQETPALREEKEVGFVEGAKVSGWVIVIGMLIVGYVFRKRIYKFLTDKGYMEEEKQRKPRDVPVAEGPREDIFKDFKPKEEEKR